MTRILCIYATRQIDSNLFMSSTIFRGLKEAGYETYMYFAGTDKVIEEFKRDYEQYFNSTIYQPINESWIKRIADKHPKTKLLYSFYRNFVLDLFTHTIDNQPFTPPAIEKIATVSCRLYHQSYQGDWP